MSRHRHLDSLVAEAHDEFDEEDSFNFHSKHSNSDAHYYEPDTEVLAKYYGDNGWYKGWVVDTNVDGTVLITFEGYEDDGPQETDPADIKLTDDAQEHEDAPNVDLETFNALVAEVKSVLGSEARDGDIKNALTRCGFNTDRTVTFLLDWIEKGRKESLAPAAKASTNTVRKPTWEPLPTPPKQQPRKSPAVKSKPSPTPFSPSSAKGKASPAMGANGKQTPAKTPTAAASARAAETPGSSALGDDMAMLGLQSGGKGGGGESDDEAVEYRFDSVEGEGEGAAGAEEEDTISLIVVGHVDAGKSTLNGHLMVLLGRVDPRLMHKYKREAQQMGKGSFALAWVLDGHAEERERGVTMDIAAAHFSTARRRVQLLDAPGHKDFVPNMISGAARADAAVLVIDGSTGEFESGLGAGGQTAEHAVLVRSLGVQQLIVAVNKLDNVDYSEERYKFIVAELGRFLRQAGYRDADVMFVPVSGLSGENLLRREDPRLSAWYTGPTLLELIDRLRPPPRAADMPVRVCVHDVFKAVGLGVCVAGRIEAGTLRRGADLAMRPGDGACQVKHVDRHGRNVAEARAGESVVLALVPASGADLDALRVGTVLCDPDYPVPAATTFLAQILTLDLAVPLTLGFQAVMYVQSVQEAVVLSRLLCTVNKSSGEVLKKKPRAIPRHTTAVVQVTCQRRVCVEAFGECKSLGRFTLREGGLTIAAGTVMRVLS